MYGHYSYLTSFNTYNYNEEIIKEKRAREANLKKFDRVNTNSSRGWQSVNVGADRVSYCTMDSIYETMKYTLESEEY